MNSGAALRTLFVVLLFSGLFAGTSRAAQDSPAAPTTRPTSSPTTAPADFEVHEILVLISDPAQPMANASALFETTLPEFVDTRRTRAPATQRSNAGPAGIIRLIGAADAKVDVKIEF